MDQHTIIQYDELNRRLICTGDWDLAHLPTINHILKKISLPSSGDFTIDGGSIQKLDTAGAWSLNELRKKLEKRGVTVHFQEFCKEQLALLNLIAKKLEDKKLSAPKQEVQPFVARLGKLFVDETSELNGYLAFIGKLSMETLRIVTQPKHLRWNAFASIIYRNGYQALPIIALLSFMIGIVIAYQMGLQLKNYGANIYIVDFLGSSVLREFGPLLTAIMVAGRTGSAFTAQLGIMQINQEIDALNTMGVTPAELLILPRITALVIVLPLLTVWADIFGVMGGMLMSNNMLDISWYDFLHRFPIVIKLSSFMVGIGKAPVFALIIGTIGCYEGMQVRGSADSVGHNTTRSVVLAIFFIIVADAIFSIIFSKLNL